MEKSIGLDKTTFRRLERTAVKNKTTKIGQIRYWLDMEEVKK